jgi:hypothetical protein
VRYIPIQSDAGVPEPTEPLFADFRREAEGMFQLPNFDAAATLDCADAELGIPLVVVYMRALRGFKTKVDKRKRPLCLSCVVTFWAKRPPVAIAVGRGMPFATGAVSIALTSGICGTCLAKGHDFVMERALDHGKRLWPDLRVINTANIAHEAGRA